MYAQAEVLTFRQSMAAKEGEAAVQRQHDEAVQAAEKIGADGGGGLRLVALEEQATAFSPFPLLPAIPDPNPRTCSLIERRPPGGVAWP